MAKNLNLVFARQALITLGQIAGRAVARSGRAIVATQSYKSRIQGGRNEFALRVVKQKAGPAEKIDLLFALDPRAAAFYRTELRE